MEEKLRYRVTKGTRDLLSQPQELGWGRGKGPEVCSI
jgi:hypothetical protein